MWEVLPKQERKVFSFGDWLDRFVLHGPAMKEAQEMFLRSVKTIPAIRALQTVPQTPPHHAEGPMVSDGIIRALAGLVAVNKGASIRSIETFAQEKSLSLEVKTLEQTLKEHVASFTVFLLFHDIAKTETLVLDAPRGSVGEREGFFLRKGVRAHTSADERALYGKLFKAHAAKQSVYSPQAQLISFFDAYEIQAHYPNHAKEALQRHESVLQTLSDTFRLTEREHALVAFTVRSHMDVIERFSRDDGISAYEVFCARARASGFDGSDAFDFLLGAVFLDACIGSLPYNEGVFSPNVDIVLAMLRAEEHVVPMIRRDRQQREADFLAAQYKTIAQKTNIDGDSVFRLIQIPIGPERALMMKQIHRAVTHPQEKMRIPHLTEELKERVERARILFDEVHHS